MVLLVADRKRHLLIPQYWAGMDTEGLAGAMELPLTRDSGAVALAVLEHRDFHVPMATNPAYGPLVGEDLLRLARCKGYVACPVRLTDGSIFGVLYADGGAEGQDVSAEQAHELAGLAQQIGLVLGMAMNPAG